MDAKRARRGGSGGGDSGPGDGPAAPDAEPERYGPLELLRLRKDDGRALLVFAREEPTPE